MELYQRAVELWKSYPIHSVSDLDGYLDSFRILFAYHSGKIENAEVTYHDTREIFENGRVSGFTGDPRTLFEQQNQKQCYEFLKGKVVSGERLSVALVLDIHRILLAGTYDVRRYVENGEHPGEFKKHEYVTGIYEVGSPPSGVERDVADLLKEVNAFSGGQVLKAAAYLHARFEYIHPFADGNGRVGRTLTNYFLMTHRHPPLIVYDEDKGLYYECLQKYDEAEELNPLHEFFRYETEKTWKRTLELREGTSQERKGLENFTQKME